MSDPVQMTLDVAMDVGDFSDQRASFIGLEIKCANRSGSTHKKNLTGHCEFSLSSKHAVTCALRVKAPW